MLTPAGARGRVRLLAAVVATVLVVLVISSLVPSTPPSSDATSQPSAPPQQSSSGSGPPPASPSPPPLAGATNGDPLPACDPSVVPQRPPPSQPTPPVPGAVTLRLVGQLGGVAQTAAVDGDRLFVGSGTQIVQVDLTDARHPREVAISARLPGSVEDIALAGDLLVAALGDGGIAILDPARGLSVRSSLGLPGHAEAVAIDGAFAFVADGPGGLRVVDLRDPSRPAVVATLFDLHRIVDVAVDAGRAYLAAADEGLIIVDVRDLAAPRPLATLFTGGYAFGVAATGARVFLADGWGGLRVVDVSDPAAPRLAATVPTMAWTMAVEVDGARAYVASGAEGLQILDLAGPDDPARVGALPLTFGHAVGVSVNGGRAALVDAAAGIRIVDVAHGPPVELSMYAPLAQANGLAVVGKRAFVAAKGQGLRVIDVSDPARPREVEAIRTEDLVMGVTAVGSNVFFGTWSRPGSKWVSSIFGIDASVPDRLAPTRPLAGPAPWLGAEVHGSTLLIAAEQVTSLVDASDPSPCMLANLETTTSLGGGFESNGVTVFGGLAYLAPYYKGKGIRIADISDPREPRLLERTGEDDSVGVLKVLAVGPTLYAIEAGPEGPVLAVFGLARPAEPKLVGMVRLPAATATGDQAGPHMVYESGHLFVADEGGGLVVVDVSEPSRPEIAGRLRLPGDAVGLVVDGAHAYVASDGGGFFVVEWSASGGGTSVDRGGEDLARPTSARSTRGGLAALRPLQHDSSGAPQAATSCLVTTTGDSGPGSLRDCLAQAQGGTLITFDPAVFPPDRPATIRVRSALRVLSGITVDGAGAGVVLDGGGDVDEGLHVEDQAVVRALTVTGFRTGIFVDGSRNTIARNVVSANSGQGIDIRGPENRVIGNLVGLDASGRRTWGTQDVGIFVSDTGNVVGGPDAADRNVISGNDLEIFFKEAHQTTIQGNYIRTDASGQVALRSPDAQAAIGVWVGSTANRIVGNVVAGVINVLDPGSSYNSILGNLVGVDATGSRSLGDEGGEIIVSEPFNRVGGTQPGEANIVARRITIDATDVIVVGNRVGLDAAGEAADADASIVAQKRGGVIGGRSPTAANVIVGGIDVRAESLVIGNRIRVKQEDQASGIRIENAGGSHVVGNLIEDGGVGIRLGEGAYRNVVRGNVVRRNEVGLLAEVSSERNVITGNAFEDSGTPARDAGAENVWDDGRRGNYWSDLAGRDADGDGVFDGARTVPSRGIDRFPLSRPPVLN